MRYPKKARMYSDITDIDSNDSTNRHCMDFNVLIPVDYSTRSKVFTVTVSDAQRIDHIDPIPLVEPWLVS